MADDAGRLRSLNLVLDLLEAIHARGAAGVSEVARAVGMSKGAAHGILTNLMDRGYLTCSPEKTYQLGIRLWELGFSAQKELGLRDTARSELEALAADTNESTHLSVYDAGEVLYLDKVTSQHAVQAYSRIGGRAPAYCVATGKALLAFQPGEEIDRVAATLQQHTPKTITDPDRLRSILAEIRSANYAVNTGEWRADVVGAAAPIIGSSHVVLGSIGVSGPVYRFTLDDVAGAVPRVVEAAQKVSKKLGSRLGG